MSIIIETAIRTWTLQLTPLWTVIHGQDELEKSLEYFIYIYMFHNSANNQMCAWILLKSYKCPFWCTKT